MTVVSWGIEILSLAILTYSVVTLWRLRRIGKLRKLAPDPPVNVRARTPGGDLVPVELVFVVRDALGRALWTPTPSTAGAVPPDADLVAASWPTGTVVIVGYRGRDGDHMVRGIESAEVDG